MRGQMRSHPTIVVLSDFGEVNGGAVQVAILGACGLAARGCRVIFVVGCGEATPLLAQAGVEVWPLGLPQVWEVRNRAAAAAAAIWSGPARERLGRLLDRLDPLHTVVHAHQWTKALSPAVLGLVADRGFPLVVTLHDYFACCPNGLLYRFKDGRACELRPLSAACALADCDRDGRAHKLVRLARQTVTQTLLRRADPIYVHVSSFARDRALPFLPEAATHRVIPNPCLVPQLPPVAVAAQQRLAFIGRLTTEKGVAVLAAALQDGEIGLTALGAGPMDTVLRQASPLVELLPWGDAAGVLALLERSRALVFPSLWPETQGLVVSEALARGVPVIASRATGAAEQIERTGGGLLVPPGDAAALRAAMHEIADDALAARLGERAYRGYWMAPPTAEAHVQALLGLYAEVADRQAARARQRDRQPLAAGIG